MKRSTMGWVAASVLGLGAAGALTLNLYGTPRSPKYTLSEGWLNGCNIKKIERGYDVGCLGDAKIGSNDVSYFMLGKVLENGTIKASTVNLDYKNAPDKNVHINVSDSGDRDFALPDDKVNIFAAPKGKYAGIADTAYRRILEQSDVIPKSNVK